MTPQDLDLMADVVEDTTAYLKKGGFLPSDRAEFLVSRLLEYGIRGKTVMEVAGLLGQPRRNLSREAAGHGLPNPSDLMDLGTAVCMARSCIEQDRKLVAAARHFGIHVNRAGLSLNRCFGVRRRDLVGKTWEELVDDFLARRWPQPQGAEGRRAAA